ncbi:unnamed protein product [Protopolystoma xenopodis]|uniref:Uncharacterized protein n=1 Tax=Protopolystoma xenopodis TaxID=117903 RepID=A0A448WPR8_9PLAT|nr:unnamed protein product [Protopolystoma xenopodis]
MMTSLFVAELTEVSNNVFHSVLKSRALARDHLLSSDGLETMQSRVDNLMTDVTSWTSKLNSSSRFSQIQFLTRVKSRHPDRRRLAAKQRMTAN